MRVTATEAKNRFGSLCAQAKREPVFVEKAGQLDTVILSVEQYQALQANQDKVSRAEVIDLSTLSGTTVMFGATVSVADEDTDEESTYQIVGTEEADIKQGRLSIASPLARALIGKSVGDSAEVATPKGPRSYEILSLSYGQAG